MQTDEQIPLSKPSFWQVPHGSQWLPKKGKSIAWKYYLVEVPTGGDISKSNSFICAHKSHKGVRILIGSSDLRGHIDRAHTSAQEISKAKAAPKAKAVPKAKSVPTTVTSAPKPAGVSSSSSPSSSTAVFSSSSVSSCSASDLAASQHVKNGPNPSGSASGTVNPPPAVAHVRLIPKVKFLQTLEQVHAALGSQDILKGEGGPGSSVAIAARSDRLLAIALPNFAYVVDLKGVGTTGFSLILPLLSSPQILKVAYDLYAISHFVKSVEDSVTPVLDIQLVAEVILKLPFDSSLYDCVKAFDPSSAVEQREKSYAAVLQGDAALTNSFVNSVASEAIWIGQAYRKLYQPLFAEREKLDQLLKYSQRRLEFAAKFPGARGVSFRQAERGIVDTVSGELFANDSGEPLDINFKLVKSCNLSPLFELLPTNLRDCFRKTDHGELVLLQGGKDGEEETFVKLDKLKDIVLDVGRYPYCWIDRRRHVIGSKDILITNVDIDDVVLNVGDFGDDNRAVVFGELHRVSAMQSRSYTITGYTMRVARTVSGGAAMLMDILLGSSLSVLILGPPATGKTTLIRDVAREVAEIYHCIIVDTSNEIGGDGVVPDKCVGHARRMMVPGKLEKQADVMIECIQNHSCEVMVIDEIGRTSETYAARTIKNRGVRMIATAHGTLRTLTKNKDLRDLVGGCQSVTMGDDMAKSRGLKNGPDGAVSKVAVQRSSEATFDVVVEVSGSNMNEWAVIADVGAAVDAIYAGQEYDCQIRTRDADGSNVRIRDAKM